MYLWGTEWGQQGPLHSAGCSPRMNPCQGTGTGELCWEPQAARAVVSPWQGTGTRCCGQVETRTWLLWHSTADGQQLPLRTMSA